MPYLLWIETVASMRLTSMVVIRQFRETHVFPHEGASNYELLLCSACVLHTCTTDVGPRCISSDPCRAIPYTMLLYGPVVDAFSLLVELQLQV
jgi:hypothetical protein